MSNTVPAKWVATKIQSQKGKRVIITGANSGIGYVTALELARHGADVVLACRSEERGEDAVKKIEEELRLSPEAGSVEFRKLDVSSLASVKAFADSFKSTEDRLDVLVNNAGIMAVPHALTVDGHESQFATNHLGHFALTAQLFKQLKNSESARVVNVSSVIHRRAKIDPNEIMTPPERYDPWVVYQNSKIFNLLFSFELNRRLKAHSISNVFAATAHPGFTATNLGDSFFKKGTLFARLLTNFSFLVPMNTPEFGALPTLYASTASNVKPDDFFGPGGLGAITGYPAKEEPSKDSKSEQFAKALWDESERLAKLKFDF